jgi:hypothetical protein
LLGAFVLIIGPADYYLLGLLRRRKLTWILFPATSLVFTIATVLIADYYLGLRDQRRSLTVVDLAADGTALRWNRFELVFAARDRQSVTELKDALWVPLIAGGFPDGMLPSPYGPSPYNPSGPPNYPYSGYPYNGRNAFRLAPHRDAEPPWYAGVVPVHFQTSEAIRQWQPQLNRMFSFEPAPAPLFPNWKAIEKAWPDLPALRTRLSENKSFDGDLWAISGGGSTQSFSSSGPILPEPILQGLCLGDSEGLLSVVSQISPTGGGNFADVQAMDTDTDDSVLAIVTKNGDDIVVYRRFFYGN